MYHIVLARTEYKIHLLYANNDKLNEQHKSEIVAACTLWPAFLVFIREK